jgi:neopullulanase
VNRRNQSSCWTRFPYVSRQFWSHWHQALRQVYPNMTMVGEVFNRDPDITSFFVGGRAQFDGIDTGVTTVFDFPLFFALRNLSRCSAATASEFKVRERK